MVEESLKEYEIVLKQLEKELSAEQMEKVLDAITIMEIIYRYKYNQADSTLIEMVKYRDEVIAENKKIISEQTKEIESMRKHINTLIKMEDYIDIED